jgi:DNA-binding FadR family transcriptional regulator
MSRGNGSGMHDTPTNRQKGPDRSPETALALLHAWLAASPIAEGERLPPERALAAALGIGRSALRRALARLEAEGRLWRHVGRGTFLGERPAAPAAAIAALAGRLGPSGVLQARLVIEPALARAAALAGTAEQIGVLPALCEAAERAPTWRHYAAQDAALHRAIAAAAGNPLLLHLFDQAEAVRRAVGPPAHHAATARPPPGHHSFAAHRAVVAAIAARDAAGAEAAMRAHIAGLLAALDP